MSFAARSDEVAQRTGRLSFSPMLFWRENEKRAARLGKNMRKKSAVPNVLVVLVTVPTPASARRIADTLITRRLAACVNVVPSVESTFWWQGKVDRCRELLLVIKTTAPRFEALRRAVLSLHPYDVPEVIALPVINGHAPYTRWVRSSVVPARPA